MERRIFLALASFSFLGILRTSKAMDEGSIQLTEEEIKKIITPRDFDLLNKSLRSFSADSRVVLKKASFTDGVKVKDDNSEYNYTLNADIDKGLVFSEELTTNDSRFLKIIKVNSDKFSQGIEGTWSESLGKWSLKYVGPNYKTRKVLRLFDKTNDYGLRFQLIDQMQKILKDSRIMGYIRGGNKINILVSNPKNSDVLNLNYDITQDSNILLKEITSDQPYRKFRFLFSAYETKEDYPFPIAHFWAANSYTIKADDESQIDLMDAEGVLNYISFNDKVDLNVFNINDWYIDESAVKGINNLANSKVF